MAEMAVNQIYELLAQKLQNDLNTYSDFTKFTVKASYNEQEPSKDLSTFNGVLTFSSEDIAPVIGLEAYTLPAQVSFVCKKEYANEVMTILTTYVKDVKGLSQTVGDYLTLPTYSTPSQSEISLVGEVGEAIKVSMYISYLVFQDIFLTNDVKVEIDGEQLYFNQIEFGKNVSADSDNMENNTVLEVVPLAQGITFQFTTFLTPKTKFLLNDILNFSVDNDTLTNTHTLTLTISEQPYSYTVVMTNGVCVGKVGGALNFSLTFGIADGSKGGAQ